MNAKINKILARMRRGRIDAFLVSAPANITYLTGYRSRDSLAIISPKGCFYLTDSRYTQEAGAHLEGFRIRQVTGSALRLCAQISKEQKWRSLAFEEQNLTYSQYSRLRREIPEKVSLTAAQTMLEELRCVKSADEIARLRRAVLIAVEAFEFIRGYLKPGISELQVAAELERFIRYQGASGASFEIIVASGPNSSFPHHAVSERKLKDNEPVLIDMGVDNQGYKSDLTRVFFLGKMNTLYSRVYSTVVEAQKRALAAIRPGVAAASIDKTARDFIAKRGYASYFGHALGHGIGLEVHEGPRIAQTNNARISAGMVFTVEPAIYLPGKFGVRVEDMVLVTRQGSEVLSGSLNK
jgi:Xaa-Pro aminopeptidase